MKSEKSTFFRLLFVLLAYRTIYVLCKALFFWAIYPWGGHDSSSIPSSFFCCASKFFLLARIPYLTCFVRHLSLVLSCDSKFFFVMAFWDLCFSVVFDHALQSPRLVCRCVDYHRTWYRRCSLVNFYKRYDIYGVSRCFSNRSISGKYFW